MQPVGDLLGDQGGVAAGSVVDDEIDLDLVFMASFTIIAVSLIMSGSSMPLIILSDGKVLEVFGYTSNRQGFLIKGLVPCLLHYALCSMLYAPCPMLHALCVPYFTLANCFRSGGSQRHKSTRK